VNAIQRRQTGELLALKRMSKADVAKSESYVRMVWAERAIMTKWDSPFLLALTHAFQDACEVYLVMPFMQGGDLRFHLSTRGVFNEIDARFYVAQIILGLEVMHGLGYVYRDLKPDNALLDTTGNLRLSDYGLALPLTPENHYTIRGNAGTEGYLAPEVCSDTSGGNGVGYGFSCDIFSLGVMIYELLHGKRPFKRQQRLGTNKLSRQFSKPGEGEEGAARVDEDVDDAANLDPDQPERLRFGNGLTSTAIDLLTKLLVLDPRKRLGCAHLSSAVADSYKTDASSDPASTPTTSSSTPSSVLNGTAACWSEIRSHPWFTGLDWDSIRTKSVTPPIKPDPDAANCNNAADLADQLMDRPPDPVDERTQKKFKGWEWRNSVEEWAKIVEANEAEQRSQATTTHLAPPNEGASNQPSHSMGDDNTNTNGNGNGVVTIQLTAASSTQVQPAATSGSDSAKKYEVAPNNNEQPQPPPQQTAAAPASGTPIRVTHAPAPASSSSPACTDEPDVTSTEEHDGAPAPLLSDVATTSSSRPVSRADRRATAAIDSNVMASFSRHKIQAAAEAKA